MSKINITEADIGRKFVTKCGDTVIIKAIDPHDARYPVETNNGSYTRELKHFHFEASVYDFSHWVDEPATPAPTPEWWATFNAVLPAVYEQWVGYPNYEKVVAIATQITNEAHK